MANAIAGSQGGQALAAPQTPPDAKPGRSGAAEFVDVWSRTEAKYRIRARLLLATNLLLFCGLCVFTYWLHTAKLHDFSLSSYFSPLRFWDSQAPNLNDFVLFPISVAQTPAHAIVLGLLVGTIVAVPIVVAILYRFKSAIPFVAAVAVFAHMPWMGMTLLMSCVLAGVWPFRMSFRFSSALVGMLPVLLYLFLATRGSAGQVGSALSPTEKALLASPWVLAILAACLMMATTLAIARWVNYRPGAVAPVIAVMFAVPLAIFHAFVGADEVSYRVLESNHGPHSQRFVPVQDVTREVQELLRPRDDPFALLALLAGNPRLAVQRVESEFTRSFLADRREADEAAGQFIATHRNSPYVPCALYIQGRALDTRLDTRKLIAAARREFYTDFPHVQSEATWSALLTGYPDSPLAIAAGLRLAQLRLRRSDTAGALQAIETIRASEAARRDSTTQPAPRGLLRTRRPEESLDLDPKPYLFEAQRLSELIVANRDDPKYGAAPLQQLACLDPHRSRYLEQLLRLTSEYPESLLIDNILVRWAAAADDHEERADRLAACIRRFPNGDATAEALFRLADLEIQSLAGSDETRLAQGINRMRELVERFGTTCWGEAAAERLRMLEPRMPAAAPAGAGRP